MTERLTLTERPGQLSSHSKRTGNQVFSASVLLISGADKSLLCMCGWGPFSTA